MLARLRATSIEDARRFLLEPGHLDDVPCPGCGSGQGEAAFELHGFTYVCCGDCGSLYVSPRPTSSALARYYGESEASRLRVEYFTAESGGARLLHVLQSRVDWIVQVIERQQCDGSDFVDVGTVYPPFLDEMHSLGLFQNRYSADPPAGLVTMLDEKGVTIGAPQTASALVATAFEQLEHQASPAAFIRRIHGMLAPGGVLFLTTRTITGFDLQVLWGRTPYIFVPEHMNLLSVEGLRAVMETAGFDLVELSTPGQLDVELVVDAVREDPKIELPRFVRYLVEHRSADTLADFQAFLQRNRLSSHVRIAARKT